MKKKLKSTTTILLIFLLTILTINNIEKINNTIIFSCNLFIKNIFPSIFIMNIIASMLIDIKIPEFLNNIFNKIFFKLFKTSEKSCFIFIISLLTGTPTNIKHINDLNLNDNETQKILLFSCIINPLFIINTVGIIFLNNKKIGIFLLISHILSNILTGITYRNYKKSVKINDSKKLKYNLKELNNNINNSNIIKTILKAIKTSIEPLLIIFTTLTFFLILITILNLNNKSIFSILLTGIIEMTTGLKYLSTSLINYNSKIYLSMIFISFGGLAIHAQIFNILNKKKIKYLPFLISKILTTIYSLIIINLLLQLDVLF